jgi:glycosyltransferase involved in cell wall biosynthesis
MMTVLGWPAFANRVQNPYNWLLYTAMVRQGARVTEFSLRRAITSTSDVFHIHWPEVAFEKADQPAALARAVTLVTLIDTLRRRGTKVVWTMHNLRSHDQRHPRTERWFQREFLKRVDGVVAVTSVGREMAISRYPSLAHVPFTIVPLGHFRGYYPATMSREAARTKLSLNKHDFVLGSFGRVRAYKNLPGLISAFAQLPRGPQRLLIAGEPSPDMNLAELAGPDVLTDLKHVSEDDIQMYHMASDLIVLPYRDILNSASAMLALSFNRPILVPDTPTMRELQQSTGSQWVHTYSPPLTPDTLAKVMHSVKSETDDLAVDLSNYDWDALATKTLSFFSTLRSPKG